jgi:hypothetical protein
VTSGTVGEVRINSASSYDSGALLDINGVTRVEAVTAASRVRLVLIDKLRLLGGSFEYVPSSDATADSLGPVMLNGVPVTSTQSSAACSGYGVRIGDSCQCWTNTPPLCAAALSQSDVSTTTASSSVSTTEPVGLSTVDPDGGSTDGSSAKGLTGVGVLDKLPM